MGNKLLPIILSYFLNSVPQFAALILVGVLLWGLSQFSQTQINTLEKIIQISDNFIGRMWFGLICFFFFYALVIYPVGKYMSDFLREWAKVQSTHYADTTEHIAGSKELYHMLSEVQKRSENHKELVSGMLEVRDTVKKIYDKFCHFYDDKQ